MNKFQNKFEKLLTISETVQEINTHFNNTKLITSHTIRYWQAKFKILRPTILNGKRRYYSKKNIDLIKLIHYLLKDQKLTIEGAKKILNNNINSLDDLDASSIKAQAFKNKIKTKSLTLLSKLKILKKNGKKNTY